MVYKINEKEVKRNELVKVISEEQVCSLEDKLNCTTYLKAVCCETDTEQIKIER